MSQAKAQPAARRFAETSRRDLWWVQPLVVLLGLLAFIVYGTWAALQGEHYYLKEGGAHYLSPFYSPVLFDSAGIDSGHAWFGDKPGWWPGWLLYSPAVLILWAPGLFRVTCYYYRGAYYKAFWGDPANCAVGEPRSSYWGENFFPLLLQNAHRYLLYLAIVYLFILGHDAWKAMWFATPGGGREFGIGVGTIVLTLNVVFLGGYTLGCHSLRHLIGGRKDCISAMPARKRAYHCVSCLNRGHMPWAWVSLLWVAFADVYVRLCAMGVWTDFRIL